SAVHPCSSSTTGAPGGPLMCRANVVPRPGSSTGPPWGSSGTRKAGSVGVPMMVVAVLTRPSALRRFDLDHLDAQRAVGRLVLDGVALARPDERRAERRVRADDVEAAGLLLHVADEVALAQVRAVALVDDGHDRAGGDRAVVGASDNLRG